MIRESRNAHILVIEDNLADTALLRMAFEDAGFDCDLTELTDGRAALDFVRQYEKGGPEPALDLVILDINLPKNDGLEILAAMRGTEAFSAIPIVVLSSSSSPRERAQIEAFSVCRFISKPADLEAFMSIGPLIKDLLAGSGLRGLQGLEAGAS